jgi:pimeloyl-ACP methyl ester carboxylesterase
MKVYFISGLAADCRVFRYIQLPEGFDAVYLDWIDPQPNESITSYALRLADNIDATHPFALIGLSMGGMIATEIAKQYHPQITILISSIPSSTHLPGYLKVAGKLRIHKLLPVSFVKSAAILKRSFTKETPEDKELLKQIIRDSDPAFIRWAMDAILKWKCEEPPAGFVHIHGTRDEVLPMRYTKPTHTIRNGGHLMVMTRANELNEIVNNCLAKLFS